MKFKIHCILKDGTEDTFIIEGENIDDIGRRALEQVERIDGIDPWSEEM